MNTRAAVMGGAALLLLAAGTASWVSLGLLRHAPAAVAEVEDAPLPMPPRPPRIAEGKQYDDCLALLAGDPDEARLMAEAWLGKGGGEAATHCLGLSRIAGGAPAVGAAILEKLAADSQAEAGLRATVYGQAAQAWMMAGQPDRAELGLTQALLLAPGDADLLVDRAGAAMALGRYEAAVEDLSVVLKDDPRRVEALVARGTALRHVGRLEAARDDLTRALAEAPDNPEALLERGILRQRRNDRVGARADWQRVVELAPDSATADLAQQNLALLDAGPVR